jgi:hypothetical protein
MIYLISHNDQFLKVGYTNNIKKRLSQLQCSSPIKLKLLHLIDGDTSLESDIHNLFKHISTSGEWFEYNQSILDYFSDKKCLLWDNGIIVNNERSIIGLVKEERLNNGLTLANVGGMLGISPQSAKEMEVREMQGSITLNSLRKVANVYNKKLEYRFVDK